MKTKIKMMMMMTTTTTTAAAAAAAMMMINNNNNNNNNFKIAAVKLKKKGVRIFQNLSHIPPVHSWEPTKWNGPVNCNEPERTACETKNSCN